MNLIENAKSILLSSMAAKPGENVLVVTDDSKLEIGNAIYLAAKELGCEAMLMVMGERSVSGEEPPAAVAAAMAAADIVLCPTAKSLTHTNARINAVKQGARIATMPNITKEMFEKGAMTADYTRVEALTAAVTELLTKASTARIVKEGCELTLDLRGRDGVPSHGVYKEPGKSGNLPSGEGYIAPVENGYAISDGKDHSYYVGELVPGGPTEKKLLAIAEKNGQTIPTVKTQEDIKK